MFGYTFLSHYSVSLTRKPENEEAYFDIWKNGKVCIEKKIKIKTATFMTRIRGSVHRNLKQQVQT